MFFPFLTTSILFVLHAKVAFAGQVPTVNGILGGTDPSDIPPASVLAASVSSALSNETTPGQLRVVENSGICETTPGVYQASGYGDLAKDQSIWFWFFASRKNPDTAPLALWFNGGPGSSSMIGLFQEMGPCRINNDSASVSLNPYSWNNEANMLFIDQPVGVGFSYGNISHVGTSQSAAEDVWRFLQIFLKDSRFSKYQKNDLAIWTESYGGHYGPTFASHILDQNQAIAAGTVQGLTLNLKVLGIGNGITDPLVQYPQYSNYSRNNPYHPLVNDTVINAITAPGGPQDMCTDLIQKCYNTGLNSTCFSAQSFCNQYILNPLAGEYDVYYVPSFDPDPYPPDITAYLRSIAPKVGAATVWTTTNAKVYFQFANAGDWMRNSRPDLEKVINAGVRTILFNGDAIDNLNVNFSQDLQLQQNSGWSSFEVQGEKAGQYKTVNNGQFSYVRFYGAGHEVPAYKSGNLSVGQAAAQMFTQAMSGQPVGAKVTTSSGSSRSAILSGPALLAVVAALLLVHG